MLAFGGVPQYLFAVVLFLESHSATAISNTPSSFGLLSDSSEQSLRAMDFASVSFSSDQLTASFPSDRLLSLSEILCAWKCTNDLNCTCFNWKRNVGRCELFYCKPTTFASTCGCLHFEVSMMCRAVRHNANVKNFADYV